MEGQDLANVVTCRDPYGWTQGPWTLEGYVSADDVAARRDKPPLKVVAYDYGIKYNILRKLASRGCRLTVLPAQATAEPELIVVAVGISRARPGRASSAVGISRVFLANSMASSTV